MRIRAGLARSVRLHSRHYDPRQTPGEGTVYDVVPWPDAVEYVTDGHHVGVRFGDGSVTWLGDLHTEELAS